MTASLPTSHTLLLKDIILLLHPLCHTSAVFKFKSGKFLAELLNLEKSGFGEFCILKELVV